MSNKIDDLLAIFDKIAHFAYNNRDLISDYKLNHETITSLLAEKDLAEFKHLQHRLIILNSLIV